MSKNKPKYRKLHELPNTEIVNIFSEFLKKEPIGNGLALFLIDFFH